jgi:hypothetical protein
MAKQRWLNAAYYRGGTSRAIIFQRKDLPSNETEWPYIFQKIMGSPDPYGRQLDGMGAGISSLSKVCVVAPSKSTEADIDYTFFAVGVKEDEVDVAGNSGNIIAAIGPYALENSMLTSRPPEDGEMEVRIMNTNTDKVIRSTFSVLEGELDISGDFSIDGVSGTSSSIQLDFLNPGGSKTGKTLPTGNVTETIDGMEVSCVDAGNPCVFVKAESLGLDHPPLPDELLEEPNFLQEIENLRHSAAVRMGLITENEQAARTIPKVGLVSVPVTHRLLSGKTQQESEVDVIIRVISDRQPHRAIPMTATICSAVAAKIKGSIVEQCVRQPTIRTDSISIGHPSGRIPATASVDSDGNVEFGTVFRTARKLMEGKVFYSG